ARRTRPYYRIHDFDSFIPGSAINVHHPTIYGSYSKTSLFLIFKRCHNIMRQYSLCNYVYMLGLVRNPKVECYCDVRICDSRHCGHWSCRLRHQS
ncbi:hypothetical protein HDU99_010220, partial [Rhizoclosmatium hyalinum]